MPINPDMLLNKDLEEVEGYWSEERIILYNIAVGSSQDPMNKSDLKFTVGPSPKVLPSFAYEELIAKFKEYLEKGGKKLPEADLYRTLEDKQLARIKELSGNMLNSVKML